MGLKRMKLEPEKIQRVFVIGLSCLGDMLLASAALWNLRLFLPKARFSLWVGPRAVAAVENDPLWDEVRTYDRNRDYPGVAGRLKFIREIREYRPDLIVDLRSGLNPIFSRAKYAPLWGWREFKLPRDMHEAERNLVAMASLGVPIRVRHLRFHILQAEREAAGNRIRSLGHRKLMAINPGGNAKENRWSEDRYKELAHYLNSKYGAVIGVIGHREDERRIALEILQELGSEGLDLTTCRSLGEMAAVLEKADLFVTNDTGPMHLASALSIPTVGIFRKINLNRFGPWGNPHRTVFPQPRCEAYPSGDSRDSMDSLTIEEVRFACDELLSEIYGRRKACQREAQGA